MIICIVSKILRLSHELFQEIALNELLLLLQLGFHQSNNKVHQEKTSNDEQQGIL